MNSKAVLRENTLCLCGYDAVIADLKTATCSVLTQQLDSATAAATSKNSEIVCCAVSKSGQRVAFTNEVKDAFVYEKMGSDWKLIRTLKLHRIATSMTFARIDDSALLVADRAGDVHEYLLNVSVAAKDTNSHDAKPSANEDQDSSSEEKCNVDDNDSDSDSEDIEDGRLLLGHYSMLTDLAFSPDLALVATADRDNKIRVSHYPNAHSIRAFCLGHTSYVIWVSCVVLDGVEVLLSASGDGTLRGWNWRTGELLGTTFCGESDTQLSKSDDVAHPQHAIPANNENWPINFVSIHHDPSQSQALLAVSFFNQQALCLFKVEVERGVSAGNNLVRFTKLGVTHLDGEPVSHVLANSSTSGLHCYVLHCTPGSKLVRLRINLQAPIGMFAEDDDLVNQVNALLSTSHSHEAAQKISLFQILQKAPRAQSGTASVGVQQYLERKEKRNVERAQKRKACQ